MLNQTQEPSWIVNNISFCYEGEKCFRNDNERKQHFFQHKEKHKINKEAFTDGSKSTGRKVGFAAVFTDTTRRGALPEEASIHTAEMTAIKIAMKERGFEMGYIYRFAELNASHQEQ